MRKSLCVLAVTAATLLSAGPAQARPPKAHASQCACTRSWAQRFVNDGWALQHYAQVFTAQNFVPYSWDWIIWRRNRIEQGVYDWAQGGYYDKGGLCANHPKVCKAIAACVTSGFITYGTSKAAGASDGAADWIAAGACAQAAAAAVMA